MNLAVLMALWWLFKQPHLAGEVSAVSDSEEEDAAVPR